LKTGILDTFRFCGLLFGHNIVLLGPTLKVVSTGKNAQVCGMTTQIEGNYHVKGWDWEKRHAVKLCCSEICCCFYVE